MMSFANISNTRYYLDLATEDYYVQGGEPEGIWAGSGASILNLKNAVQPQQLSNLMAGFSPDGKNALCQNPSKTHIPGWDLTFNAPKSVSLAWAAADNDLRQRIQWAQLNAVRDAIDLIEEFAAITRRGTGGETRENVEGLVVAVFEHSTSRALDPHLHSHAIVANTAPRTDASWGTLDSRTIMLWQKAAGMAYKVSLAEGLRELGFETELDGDSFKLNNISSEACQSFSKRALQIIETLKNRGITNRASKSGDLASLSTRDKKGEIDRPALFERWQSELKSFGITNESLQQTIKKQVSHILPISNSTLDVEVLTEALTKQKAVFRKQDAYFKAGLIALESRQSSKVMRSTVSDLFDRSETVELGKNWKHNDLFSTRTVISTEQSLISLATQLGHSEWTNISTELINKHIEQQRISLSEEQKFAIRHVCSDSQLSILQGSAGSGKSSSMRCVSDIYNELGKRVIGASIARTAAKNLERETGAKAFTIASIITSLESGRAPLSQGDVLIVDEAGQLGTFQLERLLMFGREVGFKLILVGEDKQLDAIEHGGVLRYLSSSEIVGTTRVESIRRQRQEWDRQAVANFRDGYANESLAQYAKREQLHILSNEESAKKALIDRWNKCRYHQPDKQSMVIARSWNDVLELNNTMRTQLQEEGLLGKEDVQIEATVSNRDIDVLISVGERIRFTHNDYERDYTNGDQGTVTEIEVRKNKDIRISVKLDNGRETEFLTSTYCNEDGRVFIAQAYAQTVYSAQGLTVDGQVLVYYTQSMDRAHTYVACSRHKDKAHIFVNEQEFTDDIPPSCKGEPKNIAVRAALADNMSRDSQSMLASEYLTRSQIETATSGVEIPQCIESTSLSI